ACGPPIGDPTNTGSPGIFLQSIGTPELGPQGVSNPWTWTAPDGTGSFVIRARAPETQHQDRLCYTLVDVNVGGETWVGPGDSPEDWGATCLSCAHRVQLGHGSGLFSFPNSGEALPPGPVEVTGKVALRDCASRLPVDSAVDGALPESVIVEVGSLLTPREDAVGELPVALMFASKVAFSQQDLEDSGLWTEGLLLASQVLSQAGLSVTLSQVVQLTPPGESPVEFGPGNRGALDALYQEGSEQLKPHQIPVFLLPCLERYDPIHGQRDSLNAHVPRIPGGASLGGVADGVFITVETCGLGDPEALWTDATALGHLLAHELAHYLGLYHALEESGLTDAIEDSEPTATLMHWDLESEGGVELS
ncbi:MAG: hypothetical protein VX938_10270, partial [Myxococcota bacterium]|nr:hypothetical protein [Myxococcota bacterium]